MSKLKIEVIQRPIHVNSISLVRQEPGFVHLHADLAAKWAEVSYMGRTIYLMKGPHTLYADCCYSPTEIRLKGLGGGHWKLQAEVAKYSLYIYAFRRKTGRIIWRDN